MMDVSTLTDVEKLALVEEAKLTWGEEIAQLLAEDIGLSPPTPANDDTVH